jgi:thymidine kinase
MNLKRKIETGYLEIIIGPMFSGKTSKLLDLYKQYKFCNLKVAVINHSEDTRYDNTLLSSHDKVMIPCIQTTKLNYLTDNDEIYDSDVILINEGQFFQGLFETVLMMVEGENKVVYICGLDGDFKREKFGDLLDLIPYCDRVEKLSSLCSIYNK